MKEVVSDRNLKFGGNGKAKEGKAKEKKIKSYTRDISIVFKS